MASRAVAAYESLETSSCSAVELRLTAEAITLRIKCHGTTWLQKGAELLEESGKTYLIVSPLGQRTIPNVWKATDASSDSHQFIVKHLQFDDCSKQKWPAFQLELQMQNLFGPTRFVRKMVDTIRARSESDPPMMVLEPFEKTLWSARTRRPLTMRETKLIMKSALLGLQEIHDKDLVYCGM